jgi:hypothetical protein
MAKFELRRFNNSESKILFGRLAMVHTAALTVSLPPPCLSPLSCGLSEEDPEERADG